jgi:hypothetical protein
MKMNYVQSFLVPIPLTASTCERLTWVVKFPLFECNINFLAVTLIAGYIIMSRRPNTNLICTVLFVLDNVR